MNIYYSAFTESLLSHKLFFLLCPLASYEACTSQKYKPDVIFHSYFAYFTWHSDQR